MYDILLYIFEKHNFNVETSVLMRELNNYQTRHDMFFSYEMIEVIPVFITMLLIEELTTLCARKWDKEDDILKVKKIIDEIDEKRSNGVNVDLEDYIKSIDISKSFLKRTSNGILLSDEEIDILKKYNINYEKCISTDELIFEIEEYLNEDGDASDLENLSSRLAEYKYYYETNK